MIFHCDNNVTLETLQIIIPRKLFWPMLSTHEIKELFFELSGDAILLAQEMNLFILEDEPELPTIIMPSSGVMTDF